MNIIDSSIWIEYFNGGKLADDIDIIINQTEELIVPSITITEVFKWILREFNEESALKAISVMKNGKIIHLTEKIAINAAYYGNKLKLPLADSIIYATAFVNKAQIYTMDKHFISLENVHYFETK